MASIFPSGLRNGLLENKEVSGINDVDVGSNELSVEETLKNQDAPTEILEEVKGLDANRYATKKTVAQGMLDIALLTSNASQLKYVLQVGPRHEFYMLLVVLISISIVLQVAMGLVLLSLNLLRDCLFHKPQHRTSALNINYATTGTAFIVTVLNVLLLVGLLFVVIGGLDLNEASDQPSAIILNDASAGILAIIISSLGGETSIKQKKIADFLYHVSVALMTGVVFCDVLKMTFGLDPALSEQDHFYNKSHSSFYNIMNFH
ncbi:putative Ninjurin-2 [Danaus plexippus plexippus]|uniref:Ninjurin-2 n=1 Tax=Danaus plexippus plexippus TaxID=278856 RepID=A0A212FBK4_DANPL|nr:putative Ninjurin-2 [Danaus plexippus plexippus]